MVATRQQVNLGWDAVPEEIVDEIPTQKLLPFANRRVAGCLLARALGPYSGSNAVVLGLACGGVPVADAIAQTLGLLRDVWVVRQLRLTDEPVLVIGAMAEGGALALAHDLIAKAKVTTEELKTIVEEASEKIAESARLYRRSRRAIELRGRPVILVDDGVVTADVMTAAIEGARKRGASKVIVATPIGAEQMIERLRKRADEMVCLMTPARMRHVGAWYRDFRQVSDGDVMKTLGRI